MILIRTNGASLGWNQCMCATLACAMALGCSQGTSCTADSRSGVVVTVLQPNGSRVCDGTVTVRDGSYSETLQVFGDATNCSYTSAAERAGNYTIDVVIGAQTKTVAGIAVGRDECHVVSQQITITLDP